MTVNRLHLLWPYFVLAIVLLIVFPNLTGVVVTFLKKTDEIKQKQGFDFEYFDIVRGTTLFYGTWSFLFFVLLPYGLLYTIRLLEGKSILLKLSGFYLLMVLMGVVVPDGSIVDFFMND